jgi:hypothetical protein
MYFAESFLVLAGQATRRWRLGQLGPPQEKLYLWSCCLVFGLQFGEDSDDRGALDMKLVNAMRFMNTRRKAEYCRKKVGGSSSSINEQEVLQAVDFEDTFENWTGADQEQK